MPLASYAAKWFLSTHCTDVATAGEVEVVIGVGVALSTDKIGKPGEREFIRV